MKRIFLSYRRYESSGYSRLIYEQLQKLQPDWELFIDVEDIPPGSDWRGRLAERLAWADAVLVLVGREWLTLTDSNGRRRLDDPEDVTRWEVQEALRQHKQVIPVLLEGSAYLSEEVLPESLRELAHKQAVEIRHASFDTDLEGLIGRLQQKSLRERLQQSGRLLSLEKARNWLTPVFAVFAFCLFWVGLLDLFALDTRSTTWSFAVAEAIDPMPVSQDVALLGIPADFDTRSSGARTRYARVIDRLRDAGAKAVLFDLFFELARADEDRLLASSIAESVAAGTDVFLGFRSLDGDGPGMVASIGEAASGVGLVCVGGRLDYAQTMPLAFNYREMRDEETGEVTTGVNSHPSLALLGVYGSSSVRRLNATARVLDLQRGAQSQDVRFSLLDRIRKPQPNCPALQEETRVATIFLRLSPLEDLRSAAHRFTMSELLEGAVDPAHLKGRVVIVGHEAPTDEVTVAYGFKSEQRYGYELYADAINTLSRGRVVQPLGLWPEFAVMLLSAAAGAWLGIALRKRPPVFRWPVLSLLVVAYLLGGTWLITGANMILHYTYDLFALFSAYLVFRRRAQAALMDSRR